MEPAVAIVLLVVVLGGAAFAVKRHRARDPRSAMRLGTRLLCRNDLTGAAAAFRTAALSTADPHAYLRLGMVLRRLSDPAGAVAATGGYWR